MVIFLLVWSSAHRRIFSRKGTVVVREKNKQTNKQTNREQNSLPDRFKSFFSEDKRLLLAEFRQQNRPWSFFLFIKNPLRKAVVLL